jgi:SAM-dependent methyltransferase
MHQEPEAGAFWSRRYCTEGTVWGDTHSPTVALAMPHMPPGAHVLEVGFGYGRDLVFLARHGFKVTGLEPSVTGTQMARQRLDQAGAHVEELLLTTLEDADIPAARFHAVISHRMLHLLTTREAIDKFILKLQHVMRPGALLCIGARDTQDLDTTKMLPRETGIYEYRHRPGHLVSYWDAPRFTAVFGAAFEILEFRQATEPEAHNHPVPCYITIMLARKPSP